MKVKELIKKLETFNPEMELNISHRNYEFYEIEDITFKTERYDFADDPDHGYFNPPYLSMLLGKNQNHDMEDE